MDRRTPRGESESTSLEGRHVALAGRLASLTRPQALRLIAARGGVYSPSVTRRTSLVVVGQDGWPLRRDGRVSRKLQRAAALRQRGIAVEVVREEEWLERLGLSDRHESVRRRYTLDQIATLLRIPPGRVRSWMRVGLIEPAEDRDGVACFDFRQVAALKRLAALAQLGVSPARLRRSLGRLVSWLPEVRDALTRLDLLDRRLVIRGEDGALADPTGQRLFDFATRPERPAVLYEEPPLSADDLFARGVAMENAGRLDDAETEYRDWLARFGPSPEVSFNLANVLYRRGKTAAAIERFRQTVEIDPDYVDAWSNLGCVLSEVGRHIESLAASRRALQLDPSNGNALYNLADTLDELGRPQEARAYWKLYVDHDRHSPWAEYARSRLA